LRDDTRVKIPRQSRSREDQRNLNTPRRGRNRLADVINPVLGIPTQERLLQGPGLKGLRWCDEQVNLIPVDNALPTPDREFGQLRIKPTEPDTRPFEQQARSITINANAIRRLRPPPNPCQSLVLVPPWVQRLARHDRPNLLDQIIKLALAPVA
jgi:hypothetical protein